MTIDEELERAERCLRLILRERRPVIDKERLRRRREFDRKLAILYELQNKNREALKRMEEGRERGDDEVNR